MPLIPSLCFKEQYQTFSLKKLKDNITDSVLNFFSYSILAKKLYHFRSNCSLMCDYISNNLLLI